MANWREGSGGKPKPKKQKPSSSPAAQTPEKGSDWRARQKGRSQDSGNSGKAYLQENTRKGPKNIGILNLLLFALAILVASFIAIIGCQPTKTPMLHLATLQHDDALWAPNAYAQEDRENFTLSMKDPASNIELTTGQGMAAGSVNQKPWIDLADSEFTSAIGQYLDTANGPGGPRPGGWILYLSCHGVTNYNNVPYLVAKNSNALDPGQPGQSSTDSHLVPLESILRTIAEHPKVKRYPKSYKLIVLDMGRMESQWSANRLCGNFALATRGVANQLTTKVPLENTFVLLSNDDGQKAWANPWEGGTNFGLFFGRGLMGAADTAEGAKEDDRISLGELERYLGKQVDDWAVQHYNSRQTPVLIPVGKTLPTDDVLLSRVGDTSFQVKRRDATAPDSPAQQHLAELWGAIELLGDQGITRLAPARFSLAQYDMRRAEALSVAGVAYQAPATQARQALNQSIADLADTLAQYDAVAQRQLATTDVKFFQGSSLQKNLAGASTFPIGSLAMWRAIHAGPIPSTPSLEDLEAQIQKVDRDEKVDDKKTQEKAKPLVCQDYYPAAENLLDGFQEVTNLTPAKINLALDFLKTAPNSPVAEDGEGTQVVEVEFLRMLRDFLDTLDKSFGIEADSFAARRYRLNMVQLLECRRRLERLAVVEDQRVFPWLEDDLEDAGEKRRAAEDRLFALEPNHEAIEVLDGFLKSATGLEAIEKKKARMHEAYRVADCVRTSVPFILEWLTHQPYADDVRRQRIGQGVRTLEKCHTLVAQLSPPKLEGEDRPDYGQAPLPDEAIVQQIAQDYADLVSFLNREYQDLTDDQGRKNRADSETLLAIENLLRVRYVAKLNSSVSTYNRSALRSLVAELTNPSRSSVGAQSINNANKKPDVMSPLRLGLTAYEKGPWQLALGQVGGAADYEVATLSPERYPLVDQMLLDEAPVVRFSKKTMTEAFESSLNPSRKIETFPSASSAVSAAAFTGTVVEDRSQIGSNRSTPSQIYYRIQRKEHLAWLANYMIEDFWGNDSRTPYFDRQAQVYLAAFNRETVDAPSKMASEVNSRLSQLRRDYDSWVNMGNPNETIGPQTNVINHELTIQIPRTIPEGYSAIDLLDTDAKAVEVADAAGSDAYSLPFETQPTGIYQPQRTFLQRIESKLVEKSRDNIERIRFRGNARRFPFTIEGTAPADGIEQIVEVNPFPFVQPSVVVGGHVSGTADVIFILDCSGSMGKQLAGQNMQTRMNVAKGVLNDILGSMATEKGQFRVLTMAFGNRIGWKPGVVDAVPRPGVEVPAGIVPGNDVQTLYGSNLELLLNHDPVRNEPGVYVDRIQAEVNKLDAWGETPLYYSIRKALAKVDPVKPTQIIVITDGVNWQTATSSDPFRTSALQLMGDLSRHKNENLQLQIVGFAFEGDTKNLKISKDSTPKENTLEELAWIAKYKGNGGFIPVDEPHKLHDEIEKLIQTKQKYSVREKLDPSDPKLYEFGDPWYATEDFNGKRIDFVVREWQTNSTVDIQLRGGEALQLSYDNLLKRMIFNEDPAEDAARQEVSVVDSVNGDGIYLARILNFQAPDPDTGTLEIPVRLENTKNTLFTVRPYQIWAEIEASASNSFKPNDILETRYFGDLLLRNGTQYPEFLIKLNQWQPVARWARLKLSMHLDKAVAPMKTISLRDILNGNANSASAQTEAGNFTVVSSTTLDKYKYEIMVSVEPGPGGILPHHVEVTPTPPQIKREYTFAQNDPTKILKITHHFMYESKSDAESGTNPRLDIWTRKQLITGAPSLTVDLQIPR